MILQGIKPLFGKPTFPGWYLKPFRSTSSPLSASSLAQRYSSSSNRYCNSNIINTLTQPHKQSYHLTGILTKYSSFNSPKNFVGIRHISYSPTNLARQSSQRNRVGGSNRGVFSTIFNALPKPLQSFLPIAGAAGVLFFVAAPFLILVLPPLILVGIIYFRRLQAIRRSLFEKRWDERASYHMSYQSSKVAFDEQEALKKMVMRRVAQAIQDNEHNIASNLGFDSDVKSKESPESAEYFTRSHLGLSDIHSIEEDWRVSAQGMTQFLTVYSLGLVDKNKNDKLIADVNIVVKTQTEGIGKKSSMMSDRKRNVRIELVSLNGLKKHLYVLDGPENGDDYSGSDDPVIDVEARSSK